MLKPQTPVEEILISGVREDLLMLFQFDGDTPRKDIKNKFKWFTRSNYSRFFKENDRVVKSAPFHDDFTDDLISSYFGENVLQTGFRGCAKTSLAKLFLVFVLLNDQSKTRKYIKILSRDLKNSRQIVTDVYNMILEVEPIYGDRFEDDSKKKREETMGSFTLQDGRKLTSGTVGQSQRGHIQDAYRPDWLIFDDIEDRESVRSAVITQGIIDRIAEAIDGLSASGSYYVLGNWISDQGVIQWFRNKGSVRHRSTPIMTDINDLTSATWPSLYPPEKIQQIKDDSDDFMGERMDNPENPLNKLFDLNIVNKMIEQCCDPIEQVGDWKFWEVYKPHHRYALGADTSEGVGRDSNAAVIVDFTTTRVVATYENNKIGPDVFAYEVKNGANRYGGCLVAPEVNNTGFATLTKLKEIYDNIFERTIKDDSKIFEKPTAKLGFKTTRATKPEIIFQLKTAIEDYILQIFDKGLLLELKAYGQDDLKGLEYKEGMTRHFDKLMALAIAWEMRNHALPTSYKPYKEQFDPYSVV